MVKRFLVAVALVGALAAPAAAQNCLGAAAQTFCIPDANTSGLDDAREARFNETDLVIQAQGAAGYGVVSGAVVTPQGTPDLTVAVSSGQVFVADVLATVGSGNLTISTPDNFQPRWDLITVNSSGTKAVTAGTPAVNPRIPGVPANSVALAAVWVTPGATAIHAQNIVPKRVVLPNTIAGGTPYGRWMLPMGEVSYFDTTGTTVTISAQSDGSTNMVKAAVTTAGNFDHEFDNGGADNGRLRYTGAVTKVFHVACTWSSKGAASNRYVIGVAKNGTVVAASKVMQDLTTSSVQGNAIHVVVTLATNDYLELYVGNTSGTNNATLMSLNIFAMGM